MWILISHFSQLLSPFEFTSSNFLIKTHFKFSCFSHNRDFQNRQPTKQAYIHHQLSVRHSANIIVLHNEAAISENEEPARP